MSSDFPWSAVCVEERLRPRSVLWRGSTEHRSDSADSQLPRPRGSPWTLVRSEITAPPSPALRCGSPLWSYGFFVARNPSPRFGADHPRTETFSVVGAPSPALRCGSPLFALCQAWGPHVYSALRCGWARRQTLFGDGNTFTPRFGADLPMDFDDRLDTPPRFGADHPHGGPR